MGLVEENEGASSTGPASSAEARRGVARRGTDAERWFASHGLAATATNLHLLTDEVVSKNFRIARLWHTACELSSTVGRRNFLVMVQLEGVTRVSVGSTVDVFKQGDVAVVPAGTHCRMDSDDAAARMEIEIVTSALPKATAEAFADGTVMHDPAPALTNVLTAAVHTALNSDVEPTDPSFPTFSLAISHLAAGVLIEAIAKPRTIRVRRPDHLFEEATGIIAQRASDLDFTVSILAQELLISERYLRKVFTSRGTTPQKAIRAARVTLAHHYLGRDGPRLALSEVARLAGFGHSSTLRTALREAKR